jgi:HAD superfamily hydrolase (TIGR01549 family)
MTKSLPTARTAELVLSKLLSKNDLKFMSEKAQVVLMVGLPGSGKSTVSELLAARFGFWRFSSDQVRVEELFPDQGHRVGDHDQVMQARQAVYEELARRVAVAASRGQKVVVDSTNLDDKREIILQKVLQVVPAEKVAFVLVRTPEDIMQSRFTHEGDESTQQWFRIYQKWREHLLDGTASYPLPDQYPGIRFCAVQRYDLETFDWITNIGVIVWDVDRTLYKAIPEMQQFIRARVVELIQKKKNLTAAQAQQQFDETYKKLNSTTLTLDSFGYDGRREIDQCFLEMDLEKLLKPDERLKKLLTQLKHFHHVILSNGTRAATERKLNALGLPLSFFSAIYPTYDLPVIKPDKHVFEHVIKQTGFAPHQHLSVGDMVATDILPAKAVGMRTALVGHLSPQADVSFTDVYGVGRLFGVEV